MSYLNSIELIGCTGCCACFSSCSKGAISMKANNEGFLYPVIDNTMCVRCGVCDKVCPLLHSKKQSIEKNPNTYAYINKNEEIRLRSSSGGFFTAIGEKIINQGGIVFGVKLNSNLEVIHSYTDNVEELSEFRGSKYVQSLIGNSFIECKKFLEAGKKVLFTGTPCQIEGLKNYLIKDYENLLCMDIICHGVPSSKLWKIYVDYVEKKFASRIVKTVFRRKNDGWKQFSLAFTFANASEYCVSHKKDPYLQLFLKNTCLRESCYNCHVKTKNRISDITIADFWGVQIELPDMDDDKGTSLIFIHSEKGNNMFSELTNCTIMPINPDIGIKHNPSMLESVVRPKSRDRFYYDLDKMRFDKIIRKYVTIPFFLRCYNKICRYIRKIIVH